MRLCILRYGLCQSSELFLNEPHSESYLISKYAVFHMDGPLFLELDDEGEESGIETREPDVRNSMKRKSRGMGFIVDCIAPS